MAFGGRGAPYHYGSRVASAFDREPEVFAALRGIMVELFPPLADVAITHTWGGPLGVPRDWFASVGLDRATGLAWAGGYVGDGVATSNLAGRTLADLITNRETELTALPWVNHRSRSWEPEPARWLGINGALAVVTSADSKERRTNTPSRRAKVMSRLPDVVRSDGETRTRVPRIDGDSCRRELRSDAAAPSHREQRVHATDGSDDGRHPPHVSAHATWQQRLVAQQGRDRLIAAG